MAKGVITMIDFEKWFNAAKDFETYYHKKHARITCVDGEIYEGECDGYYDEEDSKGESVIGIGLGVMIFKQEEVEKIEFLD